MSSMSINFNKTIKIILVLIILIVIWQIYNIIFRNGYLITNIKIAEVPRSIKCVIEQPGCEDGDIDGWSILHALMYFIVGIIIPDQYLVILIISVIYEFVQPYIGNHSARYIINPLVNLTGYALGSIVNKSIIKNQLQEKYSILV